MAADSEAPVTIDELADLLAGLLPADEAARLRTRIAADPDAAELLGALELIDGELADVDDEPIPDDVVARLDTAVATEQVNGPTVATDVNCDAYTPDQASHGTTAPSADPPRSVAPPIDLAARRRRKLIQAAAGLVAAAAVVGVVIAGIQPSSSTPVPGSVPAYGATDLASAWPAVAGVRDLGPLADPRALRTCFNASGLTPVAASDLLGAQQVTVDGRAGVMLAVAAPPTTGGPSVNLTVFDPDCGPDAVLATTIVPR